MARAKDDIGTKTADFRRVIEDYVSVMDAQCTAVDINQVLQAGLKIFKDRSTAQGDFREAISKFETLVVSQIIRSSFPSSAEGIIKNLQSFAYTHYNHHSGELLELAKLQELKWTHFNTQSALLKKFVQAPKKPEVKIASALTEVLNSRKVRVEQEANAQRAL